MRKRKLLLTLAFAACLAMSAGAAYAASASGVVDDAQQKAEEEVMEAMFSSKQPEPEFSCNNPPIPHPCFVYVPKVGRFSVPMGHYCGTEKRDCFAMPPGDFATPADIVKHNYQINKYITKLGQANNQMFMRFGKAVSISKNNQGDHTSAAMTTTGYPEFVPKAMMQAAINSQTVNPYPCGEMSGYAMNKSLDIIDALDSQIAADDRDYVYLMTKNAKWNNEDVAGRVQGVMDLLEVSPENGTFSNADAGRILSAYQGVQQLGLIPLDGDPKTMDEQDQSILIANAAFTRQFMGEAFRRYVLNRVGIIPYGLMKEFLTGWYEAAITPPAEATPEKPADPEPAKPAATATARTNHSAPYLRLHHTGKGRNCCDKIKTDAAGNVLPGQKIGEINQDYLNATKKNSWAWEIAQKVSASENVPAETIGLLMGIETNGGSNINTSSAGAVGIMQLMKSTATDKAVKRHILSLSPVDERTDNTKNALRATAYYKHFLDKFFKSKGGDLAAFGGYNWGPYGANMWLDHGYYNVKKDGKVVKTVTQVPLEAFCYTCKAFKIPYAALHPDEVAAAGGKRPSVHIEFDDVKADTEGYDPNMASDQEFDPDAEFGVPAQKSDNASNMTVEDASPPPLGSGGAPSKHIELGPHEVTQEELNRMNEIIPAIGDGDLISRTTAFQMVADRYLSETYQNIVQNQPFETIARELLMLEGFKAHLLRDIKLAAELNSVLWSLNTSTAAVADFETKTAALR